MEPPFTHLCVTTHARLACGGSGDDVADDVTMHTARMCVLQLQTITVTVTEFGSFP